jgi:hypothetical protein
MARPNLDRTKIEVWIKRSSLAWLTATARIEGKPRSALVRDLLTEANGARQGQRTPDVPVGCAGFKPRPGNALRCFVCGQRKRDHS